MKKFRVCSILLAAQRRITMTSGEASPAQVAENAMYWKKVSSALFYGFASFLITVVNKSVLTNYQFPSYQFLGLGQMAATIIVLSVAKKVGTVKYPPLEKNTFRRMWPLPVIYLGNMATGLGGTKELSLPMFTALRRFSILMTMVAERLILGVKATFAVQFSVFSMVGGTLIAAFDDVTFSFTGYTLVLLNDLFTASNGVFMKKKLDAKDLGKYGLMYYNCLFMFLPALLIAWQSGDLERTYLFKGWDNPMFVFQFLLSCIMGFFLSYSIMLCTNFNGALTTTIIGCLKNISVTYLGMIIGGDYIFTWINFIGLNISVLGSIFYTFVTFRKKLSVSLTTAQEPLLTKVEVI